MTDIKIFEDWFENHSGLYGKRIDGFSTHRMCEFARFYHQSKRKDNMMTEFEKAMKPYEKWVNDKLDQMIPRPEKITPKMCAAMIAQYQRELTSDEVLADVSECYPKDCVLKYEDGWYITFKSLSGEIIKSHGPYKTKSMSEPDRRVLNKR